MEDSLPELAKLQMPLVQRDRPSSNGRHAKVHVAATAACTTRIESNIYGAVTVLCADAERSFALREGARQQKDRLARVQVIFSPIRDGVEQG